MKLIKVVWEDIMFFSQTIGKDKIQNLEDCFITSTGFLIEENKTHLIMACSLKNDGDYLDVYKIPRGCIKKITRL